MNDLPTVLLVHGVGMSPELFGPLQEACGALHAVAPLRAPYRTDARTDPRALDELVDDLAEMVGSLEHALLVGVSGGATLALALACRIGTGEHTSPRLVGIIAHEPLVGPLAPELHCVIDQRASALAADDRPRRAVAFVRDLMGPETWERLPAKAQSFTLEHASTVRAEVPLFATFAPTLDELGAIRTPTLVTVGARSPAARFQAAEVIERAAAARVVTVPGGHLAAWEHPIAFAETIRQALTSCTETQPR